MLVTVDIGNTNIVVGGFNKTGSGAWNDTPEHYWRLSTTKEKTADEYGTTLLNLFSTSGVSKESVTGSIVSCVVPTLRDTFSQAMERYLGSRPIFIEPGVKTGMPILTDNPKEVGADRIVNAVGAYAIHKCELIVVDFGTAITFDYITERGEYSGGVIAPGIGVSANALFEKAARLPRVTMKRPDNVIGKNTAQCIESGLYFGFASLVDGIVEKMKKECQGGAPRVIATGGNAGLLAPGVNSIDEVDELLVLKGLKKLYEVNTQ